MDCGLEQRVKDKSQYRLVLAKMDWMTGFVNTGRTFDVQVQVQGFIQSQGDGEIRSVGAGCLKFEMAMEIVALRLPSLSLVSFTFCFHMQLIFA